jgi:hypothetical protein
MSNRLEVIARLRDEISGQLPLLNANMNRMANATEAAFRRVDRTISMVKAGIALVAGSQLFKGMTSGAGELEQAQVQLQVSAGNRPHHRRVRPTRGGWRQGGRQHHRETRERGGPLQP